MCQINYTTTKNNGRLGEIMTSNWLLLMLFLYCKLYSRKDGVSATDWISQPHLHLTNFQTEREHIKCTLICLSAAFIQWEKRRIYLNKEMLSKADQHYYHIFSAFNWQPPSASFFCPFFFLFYSSKTQICIAIIKLDLEFALFQAVFFHRTNAR